MLIQVVSKGGPRLMQILLVQISLLRFFKNVQKYLPYASLGLFHGQKSGYKTRILSTSDFDYY